MMLFHLMTYVTAHEIRTLLGKLPWSE